MYKKRKTDSDHEKLYNLKIKSFLLVDVSTISCTNRILIQPYSFMNITKLETSRQMHAYIHINIYYGFLSCAESNSAGLWQFKTSEYLVLYKADRFIEAPLSDAPPPQW